MTTYLTLTEGGQVSAHGLTLADLQARHPNTSFPTPLRATDVADMYYLPAMPTEPPAYDADTHTVAPSVPVWSPAANDGAGAWLQAWTVQARPEAEVAASLAALKASAKRQIDAEVDAITAAVVGNRAQEYLEAERQARAYIAAGYTGPVPEYVAADADAYLQTAQWSADRIAATADAWLAAQLAMRTHRLSAKAQVAEATTHAAARAALSTLAQALAPIKTGLGI